jgi:hypothetical protein
MKYHPGQKSIIAPVPVYMQEGGSLSAQGAEAPRLPAPRRPDLLHRDVQTSCIGMCRPPAPECAGLLIRLFVAEYSPKVEKHGKYG